MSLLPHQEEEQEDIGALLLPALTMEHIVEVDPHHLIVVVLCLLLEFILIIDHLSDAHLFHLVMFHTRLRHTFNTHINSIIRIASSEKIFDLLLLQLQLVPLQEVRLH
jgi:hypothetical protein